MNALNFLSERPLTDWFDYFVDDDQLARLFNDRDKDTEIGQLLVQLTEQAQTAENEFDGPIESEVDEEDARYRQIKLAKLWSLSLACCARLDWDLELIDKHATAAHLHSLFIHLLHTVFPELPTASEMLLSSIAHGSSESTLLVVFPNLSIGRPSAIRRNTMGQSDPNLVQAEALRITVAKIRTLTSLAVEILNRFTDDLEGSTMKIPLKECFLNGTRDGKLASNWNGSSTVELPLDCLLAKTHYDLLSFHFADGNDDLAKSHLLRTRHYCTTRPVLPVLDTVSLNGYCRAFGLSPDQLSISPDSLIGRHLSEKTMSIPRQSQIAVENVVHLICESIPPTIRHLQSVGIDVSTRMDILAKTLTNRLRSFVSSNQRTILMLYIGFLVEIWPSFAASIDACSSISDQFPIFKRLESAHFMIKLPDCNAIKDLLQDGDDLWQSLISFDTAEIRRIFKRMPTFIPARYTVPTILGEGILTRISAGPHQDYITVLMAKLNQLGEIGNIASWQQGVNSCVQELGSLGKDKNIQQLYALEALRIQLKQWHMKLCRTTRKLEFDELTKELSVRVEGILSLVIAEKIQLNEDLILPLSTFLINTANWLLLRDKTIPQSPFVDLAKMLVVFVKSRDNIERRHITEALWKVLLPTMEDAVQTKRSADKNTKMLVFRHSTRNQLLSRRQLLMFLANIKEQDSLALLLSLFGKLFNSSNGGIDRLFIEFDDFWPTKYDCSNVNVDFLDEVLSVTLANSLLVNPTNAFCLRCKADFLLAKREYEDAIRTYLEVLFVSSWGFSRPFPDNVVNDMMWHKLIKCAWKTNCRTEEALLTQMLNDPKEVFRSAAQALSAPVTYDAPSVYLPFLCDSNLMEFAAEAYTMAGQTHKLEMVIKAMSTQDMNVHNVPSVIVCEVNRRKSRFLKALCNKYLA